MDHLKWRLSWMFLLPCLQASGVDGFLIKNAHLEKCIHASSHEVEKVGLADCRPHSLQHQWAWDAASRAIVNRETGLCLTVSTPQEFALARLEACGDRVRQGWVCSKKGHLTLQGLGLRLSAKPGGHKAFLSPEKNKFSSRWKTETDEIVCAVHTAAAPGPSHPMEESLGTLGWVPKSKTVTSAEIHTLSVDAAITSPTTILDNKTHLASALPKNGDVSSEGNQERHTHHKKHQRKAAGSRHPGTNWKTVMLVLCPLAFILGVIILMLNIHYNKKKKKILSALKSRQVSYEQQLPSPGTTSGSTKTQAIPASPSPSLKHGEILIEWKDGTVTPLFSNTNDQIC